MSDETTPETPEVTPEVPVEEEKVSISKYQEEQAARRNAEEAAHQNRLLALQAYESAQRQQRREPEPPIDPELAKLLYPYVKPILEQNQALQQQVQALANTTQVDQDYRWLEQNVPYLDDVRDDLAKRIEALPKAAQDAVLGNKDVLKAWADELHAAKKGQSGDAAKANARARATTVTGASPMPTAGPTSMDWSKPLTQEEFWQREAKIQAARQQRRIPS